MIGPERAAAYGQLTEALATVALRVRQEPSAEAARLSAALVELGAAPSERTAGDLVGVLLGLLLRATLRPRPRAARWWMGPLASLVLGSAALAFGLGLTGAAPLRVTPGVVLAAPAPLVALVLARASETDWATAQNDLDATWERDWPATIARLDAFLARWPEHAGARDKLYAALVAHGSALADSGQRREGTAALERAARLLPERGEAFVALEHPGSGG